MNPFEALAILASSEQWCWKLRCTTCGHTHFRYAFRELARGKSPSDEDWIIKKERTSYEDELGALPKRYSPKEKERILELCSEASLATISDGCSFPDWLGYLGLVLHHMRSADSTYKALSIYWAKQMLEMVSSESSLRDRLKNVVAGKDLLRLNDLEAVEQNLSIT